ncbi:hypothetical protein AAZX31_13G195400 [Glycine max]
MLLQWQIITLNRSKQRRCMSFMMPKNNFILCPIQELRWGPIKLILFYRINSEIFMFSSVSIITGPVAVSVVPSMLISPRTPKQVCSFIFICHSRSRRGIRF